MRQIQAKKESVAVNVRERTRERRASFLDASISIDSEMEDSHAMNDGFIFLYL